VVGVVADILAGPIPTLASVMPGVDPRIDAAVRRCLTRDLDQRMPSAQALIDALAPVLASLTGQARASLVELEVEPDMDDLTTQPKAHPDDLDDYEATVARPALGLHAVTLASRGGAHRLALGGRAADDDENETAVLRGAHLLPPARPLDPVASTTQPIDLPVSEDMPTAVQVPIPAGSHPGTMGAPVSLRQSTVLMHDGATRPDLPRAMAAALAPPRAVPAPAPSQPMLAPRVISFGAPPPVPPLGVPAWPQPQARTVTLPQNNDESDPSRMTLPPGWNARRDAARVLWMTAIAGLVVGLVVFAGLSLLR
jgi:serine/threonine-protein kinase